MPAAVAGRMRRSKRGADRIEVPAAEVRAEWRPSWARAGDFPPMGEDTPRTGLLALTIAAIQRRPALGYLHLGIPIGSVDGYPDLHIWGPGGMAWWELKGSKGRVYAHQVAVIEAIRLAGGTARFVWPEEYHLGWVDAELDRLAGLAGAGAAAPMGPPRPAAKRVLKPGHYFCGCPLDRPHVCATYGGGAA